jgi:uncharacterized protein
VTLILDSSGLLSAISSDQNFHQEAKGVLAEHRGPRVISPFVLAELDYMILTRYGQAEEMSLLSEVSRDVYRLEQFSSPDIAEVLSVIRQHEGFGSLGLADASNVVLARRHDTLDLLTLDERHFRTLRGPGNRPFRLLPADL